MRNCLGAGFHRCGIRRTGGYSVSAADEISVYVMSSVALRRCGRGRYVLQTYPEIRSSVGECDRSRRTPVNFSASGRDGFATATRFEIHLTTVVQRLGCGVERGGVS